VAARLAAYSVALIVGITFIAGLIVGAQRADDGPVDVMVVNGRVYTADGKGTTAEAVAIQGNKIMRVGTTREIQRLRRAQTVVIDAKGGAVLPGFIETNAQLLETTPESPDEPIIGPLLPHARSDDLAAVRAAAVDAHRRGITSVQDAGGTPQELDIYDELRRDGELTLRVYGALSATAGMTSEQLDAFDELREKYADDPLFKAGAVQIVVSDENPSTNFTSAELNRLVAELDRRGWQIVIHAEDDQAAAMAYEAFQHAIEQNPVPSRGRRHRLEPGEIIGPIDVAKFDALGIVRPLPVELETLRRAIDAVTRQAAWTSFDEQRKGVIAHDMLADVVVLTKDILAQPAATLEDAEVSVTIFDGKVVFQKSTDSDY
jgi:predicted amidohydrolase YtcJ